MKIQISVKGTSIEAWELPLDLARVATEAHRERLEDRDMEVVLTGEVELQGVATVALVAGRNGFYLESTVVDKETTALVFSKKVPSQIPF